MINHTVLVGSENLILEKRMTAVHGVIAPDNDEYQTFTVLLCRKHYQEWRKKFC